MYSVESKYGRGRVLLVDAISLLANSAVYHLFITAWIGDWQIMLWQSRFINLKAVRKDTGNRYYASNQLSEQTDC